MRASALTLATVLLAAGCGQGDAPSIAGSWVEIATLPGSGFEMTLLASGTQVSGTGVAHVEAGADQAFTVQGDTTQLVFSFASGQPSQTYGVAQPDVDHLQLTNGASPPLEFVRR